MAIKNSKYKIKNNTGYDVFHFETNSKAVKLLNDRKESVGDIEELLFKGKRIDEGNITDIKVSGVYNIGDRTQGLPPGMSTAPYLLIVSAAGAIGSPSLVRYTIYDVKGNKKEMVVVHGKSSGWKTGGLEIEQNLSSLSSILGEKNSLKTKDKTNIVNAINEVSSNLVTEQEELKVLKKEFNSHNHDDRYLRASGGTRLNDDIIFRSDVGIVAQGAETGKNKDIIRNYQAGKQLIFGSNESMVEIKGYGDLLYNGKKVLVSDNKVNGTNATHLGGTLASSFARTDTSNSFKELNTFEKGVKASLIDSGNSLTLKTGDKNIFFTNGTVKAHTVQIDSSQINPYLLIGGVNKSGLFMTLNKDTEIFNVRASNHTGGNIFEVKLSDGVVKFERGISVQGKMLYMQKTQPSGTDHPVGSIWIGG